MTQKNRKEEIKVLGIAGSLREGSYNRALIRSAQELAPERMKIRILENDLLARIPLYDDDLRRRKTPEPVAAMNAEIRKADGLILAFPEYNHSISGVMKNALDWASRPPDDSSLDGKPVALMSASTGSFGGVRAQMHMRQVCVYTNMLPLNKPQVLVDLAKEKFDQGRLVDETSLQFLREQMEAFLAWIEQVGFGKD